MISWYGLSINNIYKVTTVKVQSKGRYFLLKKLLFKDYNKRLEGTTQASSRVSDITNPTIDIIPTPRNMIYRFIYHDRIC